MTPDVFIEKWSQSTTKERASAQEHFIDLCRVLGEKTPHEADPTGEWYAFEKGVEKTGAGRGWADVWKKGHFGWEYKSKSGGRASTMQRALQQLQLYSLALESPPLLIVSDIDTIEIHTAFQNAVQDIHVIQNEDLVDPRKLNLLRWAFTDPDRLKPKRTRHQVTDEAAGKFATLAFALREAGHEPLRVAHFLNRVLFCMFAEDAGLLKSSLFTKLAERGVQYPEHFDTIVKRLFQAMQTGGPFGNEVVDWFNGGLFDSDDSLPLSLDQIRIVRDLARLDWSQIEPAIFGTLFERGLDPDKRSQLGAHYTDPESIMRLVNPSIVEPLLAEWREVRGEISKQMEQMEKVKTKAATERRRKRAQDAFFQFLEKLRNFRALDPACGSGNFLYLTLQALKRIEHRANIEAEALGLERQAPSVGPEAVMGIEINAYAAELARVTVWIGEIQWMLEHGYSLSRNPILKPLDNIQQHDAILNTDGTEPIWPSANVIVGNPPFLGDKKLLRELGHDYVTRLRSLYDERVPGGADLVTYWYEKAHRYAVENPGTRVGLVATNSIRSGSNRKVLKQIVEDATIYEAWSDEPWVNEGAAVRVSLICFGTNIDDQARRLDGQVVSEIFTDLTGSKTGLQSVDLTTAKRLDENQAKSFMGITKSGPFDIPSELARQWLEEPNPHGLPNSDVLRPSVNGQDLSRRPSGDWIIDFGQRTESQASLYEAPFRYAKEVIYPARQKSRTKKNREFWWRWERPRPEMFSAFNGHSRYIATCLVSKHRFFVWLHASVVPENVVITIARSDDCSLGVVHSKYHELWALRMCSWLGKGNDPRYTPTTTFETFPFPAGLTPNLESDAYSNRNADLIAEKTRSLIRLRDEWLNPTEWVRRVPEVATGYPERIIAQAGCESKLKKRTLTNLYNERPTWLDNAHCELDEAVAASYGWPADLREDQILANLLELNLERAAQSDDFTLT